MTTRWRPDPTIPEFLAVLLMLGACALVVAGCLPPPRGGECAPGGVRCAEDGSAVEFCTSAGWWDPLPCPEDWTCNHPTGGAPSCWP